MKGTSNSFTPFVRVAALVLLGSILAGCNQANSEITEEVIKPVKLLEIPMPANQASNAFPGKLEATQRAQLSFQVPGEIEQLTVRVGQRVEQGQVLAVLDDQDYRLAFDAKLAEFELAQSQFQRAKQLYGKKLISTDQFDQRETAFKAAAANLEQAKTDVEHTLIKAPFNGVVSLKFVNQNQFVGANQAVMNIQNVDEMDVSFNLPVPFVKKSSLSAIRQTAVWVEMDNHPAQPILAEFKELSTKPDADTNSYTAKVTLSPSRSDELAFRHGWSGSTLPNQSWRMPCACRKVPGLRSKTVKEHCGSLTLQRVLSMPCKLLLTMRVKWYQA